MTFLTDKFANALTECDIRINGHTLNDLIIRRYRNNKKIYHWLAQSSLRAGNLIGARKIFETGVENNPDSVDFIESLSVVLLRMGDYEKAIEYLLISLNIIDPYKADKTRLASIYSLLAKANLYIGNLEPVEVYIAKSQELAAWDLNACDTLVEFFLKIEEKEKITPFLKEFIKNFPTLYPPCAWLADYYYFYLQDFDSAIFWYALALSKAKDKNTREYCNQYYSVSNLVAACVTNFSKLYLSIGKAENALLLINEYAHYPYKDNIIANEILLDYHIFLKNYDEANIIINKLLRKKPKIYEYWAYLAKIQSLSHRFDEAESSLRKAFALNQHSFAVIDIASEIYMMKHDWQNAEGALQKLIKIFPFDLEYQERMKECLTHLHED